MPYSVPNRSRFVLLVAMVGVLTGTLLPRALAQVESGERRFLVMLAVPPKSYPGWPPSGGNALPNPNDCWDHYFDRVKPDVESFHEYWNEISYGTVNVSGDVAGWAEIAWPIFPASGPTFSSGAVLPFNDLNNDGLFGAFGGESFNENFQMYIVDDNGDLPGPFVAPQGLIDGWWTPGERFLDVNGNQRYDSLLEDSMDGWGTETCAKDGVIDSGEFCDADGDNTWDYPEPFEDFLRIYIPTADPPWVRLDPSYRNPNQGTGIGGAQWALEYIRRNYPGEMGTLPDPGVDLNDPNDDIPGS